MRNHLFTWKCEAHNQIVPNNRSCPLCVALQRDRLHASGVAYLEESIVREVADIERRRRELKQPAVEALLQYFAFHCDPKLVIVFHTLLRDLYPTKSERALFVKYATTEDDRLAKYLLNVTHADPVTQRRLRSGAAKQLRIKARECFHAYMQMPCRRVLLRDAAQYLEDVHKRSSSPTHKQVVRLQFEKTVRELLAHYYKDYSEFERSTVFFTRYVQLDLVDMLVTAYFNGGRWAV